VLRVGEARLDLLECVADEHGIWEERQASLSLSE